jgi:hypothetical protein
MNPALIKTGHDIAKFACRKMRGSESNDIEWAVSTRRQCCLGGAEIRCSKTEGFTFSENLIQR